MSKQQNIQSSSRATPNELCVEVAKCLRQMYFRQGRSFNQKLQRFEAAIASVSTYRAADKMIRELVDGLGDTYTMYHEASIHRAIRKQRSAGLQGIGILIQPKRYDNGRLIRNGYGQEIPQCDQDGYPVLFDVFEGSQAAKAGLRKGDAILSIDGRATAKLSLIKVIDLIRGKEGSKVKLIFRRGDKKCTRTIKRTTYSVAGFAAGMIGDFGYARLRNFDSPTLVQQFAHCLGQLVAANANGLIVDLRGNGGGSTLTSMNIIDMFVEEGEICHDLGRRDGQLIHERIRSTSENTVFISTKGKRRLATRSEPRQIPRLWTKPVVVLVDEKSASSAEHLAGTLRDLIGARLVGKRTYGKGIGQMRLTLPNKCGLTVTSRRWYLPSGFWVGDAATKRIGLTPDVEVEGDDDDAFIQAALKAF